MIDIVLMRRGNFYVPFSDYDRQQGLIYPENKPLRGKISGASKIRAYRELCAYKGSCDYIADLQLDPNKSTAWQVDHWSKLKFGFVKGTIFYDDGSFQWIPDSLSYDNCGQPRSHAFITQALAAHADLAGCSDTDEYLRMLDNQGGAHARPKSQAKA